MWRNCGQSAMAVDGESAFLGRRLVGRPGERGEPENLFNTKSFLLTNWVGVL